MVLVSEGILDGNQEQAVLLFANDEGDLAALELMWMTPTPPSSFPVPNGVRVSAIETVGRP